MKKIKDKLKYEFNPLTGELDLISEFNTDRILTHTRNSTGHMLTTWDPRSQKYIDLEPLIVVDNNGNVVVVK